MFHVKHAKADLEALGIDVSRETLDKLSIYAELLKKWQKAINLVSANTVENAWRRHFFDSARLAPFISGDIEVIYDLGSGAGFPGLVLAILRPDIEMHLIEANQRKCEFLRNVSRETSAPVIIQNGRIEDLYDKMIAPDLVTARALTSLVGLLGYTYPWAKENLAMEMLFLKGEIVDIEIEAAQKRYRFEYTKYAGEAEEGGAVLAIKNLSEDV